MTGYLDDVLVRPWVPTRTSLLDCSENLSSRELAWIIFRCVWSDSATGAGEGALQIWDKLSKYEYAVRRAWNPFAHPLPVYGHWSLVVSYRTSSVTCGTALSVDRFYNGDRTACPFQDNKWLLPGKHKHKHIQANTHIYKHSKIFD